MKMFKRLAALLISALMICAPADFSLADEMGKEYYVSQSIGNDTDGDGSFEKPFLTIQRAADIMKAGDTCYVRGGNYHEQVILSSSGTADKPITFKPYMDEKVFVLAADVIKNWQKHEGNIWVSSDMDWNMEDYGSENQLFIGDEAMLLARWPNIPDASDLMHPGLSYIKDGDRSFITDTAIKEPAGFWNGAKVHIQAGYNWYNCTADIVKHTADGRLDLTKYSYGDYEVYRPAAGNPYYIYDSYNAMDTEKEWYYSREDKKIYLYYAKNPNELEVSARSRAFTFVLDNQSHINIEGFTLRGAGISLKNTEYILLDRMNIGYLANTQHIDGKNISLTNSHIFHAPRCLLSVTGRGNKVFNCLVEYGNYEGINDPLFSVQGAYEAYIGYNTIRKGGRSCLNQGAMSSIIEYNDIYDAGYLTEDLGICYTSIVSGGGTEFRYNWLHDVHSKRAGMGYYQDNHNQSFVIHHNVVWDSHMMKNSSANDFAAICLNLPAENNLVYNNTFIGTAIPISPSVNYTQHSYVVNNIITGQDRMMKSINKYNNIWGSVDPKFIDYNYFDFRIGADSPAIDAGKYIEGITKNFSGDKPDIGAYEYGEERWIPGHNWDNPPELKYEPLGCTPYANLVAGAGFEGDDLERNFNEFGWSKNGDVSRVFAWSNSEYELERRSGAYGMQLGKIPTVTRPPDVLISSSEKALEIQSKLNGSINFPKNKLSFFKENTIKGIKEMIVSSSELLADGGFENGTDSIKDFFPESCTLDYSTDEKFSGERSMKISDMQYSWSSFRKTMKNHSNRKFRLSLKIKGKPGVRFNVSVVPDIDNRTDYPSVIKSHVFKSSDWETFSFIFEINGDVGTGRINTDYTGWKGGVYYVDDVSLIDITAVDKITKYAAGILPSVSKELLEIENAELTPDKIAEVVEKTCHDMLKVNQRLAIESLSDVLNTQLDSCISREAGVKYTVKNLRPNRTYAYMCRGKVLNENDRIDFKVSDYSGKDVTYSTSSTKWDSYALRFTTGPEDTSATIYAQKPTGINAAYVDDLLVYEVDNTVHPAINAAVIVDNGDFKDGNIWPWYSYGGELSILPSGNDYALRVENTFARQELTSISPKCAYEFGADFVLENCTSDTADISISILVLDKEDKISEFVIAEGTINKNAMTKVEGSALIDVGSFVSGSLKIQLKDSKGSFLMDNAECVQQLPPSVPGTGDADPSIEKAISDKSGWIFSMGEQGGIVANGKAQFSIGAMCYTGKTYRDFTMSFNMLIEGFQKGHYPIIAIRSSNPTAYSSGYVFVIKDSVIELQKYKQNSPSAMLFIGDEDNPTGIHGAAKNNTSFIMGEENLVEVGSYNEENGVRVILKINGEMVYDFLDTVSPIDNSGYLLYYTGGVRSISITNPKQ